MTFENRLYCNLISGAVVRFLKYDSEGEEIIMNLLSDLFILSLLA